MKNLYRRYRPLKLGDVVGQDQVIKPLESSLIQGKVGHAYLFVGPRGCGKTSVARILAHEINGFKYELEDDYVDIIEIDGASNRGIDNIRDLREKVMIAPTSGKYKVYIIDEVHMLTKEAFNALLKTLEEPPTHVVFIMATTDAYKVPVTITSRAQVFTFKLADTGVMQGFLKTVCEREEIRISDDALKIVAKKGGGSFRDSLSLLDQISTLSDNEITKEMIISAIGLPEDEKISEILSSYVRGDVINITTILKELLASGIKAETLNEELISYIIDNPRPELVKLLSKLVDVKAPYAEARILVALLGDATVFHFPESKNQKVPQDNISPTNKLEEPANNSFDWNGFVEKVRSLSDAIYSQLIKTEYSFIDNTLHIYPKRKIIQIILSRDNNKRILSEAASGVKITIHDFNDTPNQTTKDEVLDKISAIMGGEVRNDDGGNPFGK